MRCTLTVAALELAKTAPRVKCPRPAISTRPGSFFIAPPKKKAEEPLAPDDPKAKVTEIKALLQAQGEASANLKARLDEIERLL